MERIEADAVESALEMVLSARLAIDGDARSSGLAQGVTPWSSGETA
jgi:hypothetical protein